MKKNTLLVLLTSLFINCLYSQNLLVNGDFESGGVGTGFNINATGYNFISSATGTTAAGDYAFGVNPLPYNTSNFLTGFDHTTGTGTGKMMIIDGSTDGGNPSFWKAGNTGGGICGLTVGATYSFSYWIKSISSNVTNPATQADIRVVFNNATIVTSPSSTLASLPASGWQLRTYTFTPTNACVNIELRNFNVNPVGNDFAVDDFRLTPPLQPLAITYSSVNTSCIGSTDGSIVAYGVNGTLTYNTYTLSGTSSQTNTTGIFSGLSAGTYNISVTDSAGTTVSQGGIVISGPANPLTINSSSAVCIGTSVSLSAGGGTGYSWTAVPADASLTSPNSPTPTVTPLVTTTYTVSSSVTINKNLITNGGFESGNVAFTSDYQYFNPTNTTYVQKAYGVVSNPNTWEIGFTACPDHTSGTGKMLVVDGSTVNAGNDKVWGQTVPVTAGQNYSFSYWVQTLSLPNLASIEVKINGVSIGIDFAPSVTTCGNWTQYTYSWSSGASTLAQISIYDKLVASGGNDFAIDDISFTTSVTCTFTKSTTVTVNPKPSVFVNDGVLCNTTGSTVLITATVVPAAGPYSYVWTVPATAVNPGNVASFNASVVGPYTVIVTNTSTGCVGAPATGTVSNTLPSSNCASATQVCPGGGIRYCNTTGVASGGSRGCLGSTPNPAWFYLQVGTSGPIVLNISQGTTPAANNLDVDFICYGPFTAPTCTGLGASNTIDCNYSTAPVETCTIPNAIAGQVYMVLITNFANQAGTILFNQTNSTNPGAGAITCIVNCPLTIAGDNQICQGTSTTLTASISGATTYTWTSTVPGFTAGNTQVINVTEPGTYNLTVVKPGCNITPASFTLTNFPIPNTAPGNDLTVCNTTFNLNLNTPVISNGVPDLTISYYATLTDLNNGIPILTPAAYAGFDGEVIYTQIQDDATFCTYNGSPFTLHIVCTTTCDTITNPSSNQTICLNGDPTALSVSTNLTAANSISFVYFNSLQTGSNMYTGGIPLSTVTPVAGTASYDPPALSNPFSLPNIAGTYYVYAIANPTPTDPSCRPYQLIQVVVTPLASINLTSAASTTNQTVCAGTAIVNITYAFGGSATGATVTGLPTGVTATTTGSTVTISGTPSPASATPYNYTITTTGGNCGTPSLSGTITVNPGVVLTLTSAASTTTQTVCIGTPITPITYTFGGTATNATIIGLPTGVTATVSGTTVTINGTPTVSSATPFNYTVTTTGGSCGTLSLGGTITVNPLATLTLTSAVTTSNQTVCSGSPIINITYTFGGTATGATVTGLPTGVTATVSGTTVTISGSPTPVGNFPYTIITTGGNCGTPSLSGTIIVNPVSTLTLTSAVPTTSQSICLNDPITNIVYTFGGSAIGATITGLPGGVIATIAGNVVTISGTPSTSSATPYTYTVTAAGGSCGFPSLSGTITVSPNATLVLTSTASTTSQTVCVNSAITPITYTFGGSATGATVTGLPAGVTATVSGTTVTISGSPNTTLGSPFGYTITTTGGACGTPSLTGTITVNPLAVIILTSLPATTTQTVCVGSPITSITYNFGGTATGTTVTGLPLGVSASTTGNTVTISGTPTLSSATPYTYTITTTGGSCGTPSLSGTITVNPTATLTLTSTAATTAQTVCVGSPITNITYTFGGTATGATVTGLPAGVTATVSGTTVTISGTPSTTVGSPFGYTVATTGGSCGAPTLSGTITVNPLATLVLTSAVATANQTVCVNSAITSITYDFGGTATGATVTGLPAGFTASTTGNTITISGTPTTTVGSPFNYTITTTGGSCGTPSLSGTITVNPLATLVLTSTAATTAQTVCVGSPITNITYTFGGTATGATVTGLPAGVTFAVSGTTVTISGAPSTTVGSPFGYTVATTGGSCGSPSLSGTITVNPLATLVLTSAAATANQTVCVNSAITSITYDFGGTATGATVTGLPAGFTASTTGNTITISGTPTTTVGSPFNYTITSTGGSCGTPSLSGTITVNPLATLALTSPVSTTAQTVCVGSPITNITYTFGGTATGATVTGLPAGVTATVSGTTVTISGTPSTTVGSPFGYTITTTGGSCGTPSLSGTITVNPLATLVLTSAPATTGQTVCVGAAITPIEYTFGGTATAVTVTGLPAGVSASTTGNVVTISGSPNLASATPYNYTITTTGGSCGTPSLSGSIIVNPLATLTLTSAGSTSSQTVCENVAIANITYSYGGTATGITVTGLPAGVTGVVTGTTLTISGTPTTTVGSPFTYTVTTTGGNCGTPSLTGTITVNPTTTLVLTTAPATANQTVCINSPITTIVYTYSGSATGITVTGLPAGVTSSVSGTTLTISGTPTVSSATAYPFIVSTTGGSCGTPTLSGSIKSISAPVITQPSDYEVCDDNNDGVSCLFYLSTKDTEITTATGLTITYHLTPTDASTGANPITQNPYCNINNAFTQTLYPRVVDPAAPACYSTTTLNLIVNPKPLVTTVSNYELCDNNSPGDGIEQFNLPTKSAEIINGQVPMTVTYYPTQNDAINSVLANALPNLYSSTTKLIWYNIKNTTTGCSSVGSFNLVVNPLPSATVNSPTVCQGATATVTATPNVAGSYSYAWSVPAGVSPPGNVASFTTTVAGTYSVVVTNTVTGCVSATPSAFGVVTLITAPSITQPSNYVVCDDNNDGVSCLFNLSTKDAEISTQAGIDITYHLTLTDSQTNSNAISETTPYCNIANPQTIYVRVFNPLAPACSSYTTFQLIVNPKPVANLPQDYHLCAPTYGATNAVFNLTSVVTPQVLGSTLPAANYTVTYYESLSDAQAPINAISPASAYPSATKKLWIRVQNNATSCFDIITVELVVDPLPTVLSFYAQYELCETTAPIGKEFFNLDSKVNYILLSNLGMQVTFYPTLAQAQAGTGAITNTAAYENVPLYVQTIGIRVTNTATGCYSISTMDLVVNPKPQPIPQAQPYTICDTDTDGFACFDLNTLTPNITFQTVGVYTITYHLTKPDAESNTNPISTTTPYCNNDPFIQLLWIRATNPTTGCYNTMQIELNVDPAPVVPINLTSIVKCDEDANPQDGCTTFNLTSQNPAVLAQQPLAGSNYTISYYTTQAAASSSPAGAAIVPANNYTSCVPTATIWVRVQNNATGCYSVGSFDIQINTPIVLTTPTLYSVCDDDSTPNNLHTTFNLTDFIGPIPGHTIAYYTDPGHLIPIATPPSAFENIIDATQTIFLVVTNTTTGCKSYRTLTVQVLPIPEPNTDLTAPQYLLEACDDNYTTTPNDGYEIFDLTTNALYIMNGDTNVTLHYFPSYNDAITIGYVNEITNPTMASVNGNVWIRVESNYFIGSDNQHCYVLVEQPVKVHPLPLITPSVVYQECDNDTDGFTQFNLNSQAVALLSGNPTPVVTSDYTLTFYETPPPSAAISNPNAYTNTNTTGNTQTIYVIATNIATGCKSPVGQFTIMVNPKPILNKPSDYAHCDDEVNDNDGYYPYDLNALIPAILGSTQSQTDYTVSFYDTQYNPPLLNPAAITNTIGYEAYTHTVWVSVKNINTGCERIDSFNILIEQPPTPVITADSNVICVDFNTHQVVRELVLTADNQTTYLAGTTIPTYTYQWFDQAGAAISGATAQTYTVSNPLADDTSTTFTVQMTSTTLGCPASSPSFEVLQSGQAVPMPAGTSGYTITNAFSENQTITVTVDGYGDYQYSLDDGPRQDSNVFENVPVGPHNITVWDSEGGVTSSCDPLIITGVLSIDYPHYFTPNGDGIHDYWNIVGLSTQVNAKIYIFDRQGKLIKQISPQSNGWDGTYNGNLMPATDYWFSVYYNEADAVKQFRAHFTLKR